MRLPRVRSRFAAREWEMFQIGGALRGAPRSYPSLRISVRDIGTIQSMAKLLPINTEAMFAAM